MMSDRLQEIKERCLRATIGPWQDNESGVSATDGAIPWMIVSWPSTDMFETDTTISNLQFISHARQDIPWLLAEVDRLREALCEIAAIGGCCLTPGCSVDDPRCEWMIAHATLTKDNDHD